MPFFDVASASPQDYARQLGDVIQAHHGFALRGRSYEGSGIGLALVQELVILHGGSMQVSSEVDRGSVFAVRVPAGNTHPPAERIGAARTPTSTSLRGDVYLEEGLQWLPDDRRAAIPELATESSPTLEGSRILELLAEPERFAALARELSNCPSGQQDGNLGQIGRGDTAPEFERALFRLGPTGILRELVKTRHGLHVVAVDRRIHGEILPYEVVRDRIAERLKANVEEQAPRQYVSFLAGQAKVLGVDLHAAPTPLVQ